MHIEPSLYISNNRTALACTAGESSCVGSDPRRRPLLTTKMASSSGDLTNGGGGGGGYMVHSGCGATASAPTTTTTTKTKPLTMFYNGGVAVFHLPQDKVSPRLVVFDLMPCRRAYARVYADNNMHAAMTTGGGCHEHGGG